MQKVLTFGLLIIILLTLCLLLLQCKQVVCADSIPQITFMYNGNSLCYFKNNAKTFIFNAKEQRFNKNGTPQEQAKLIKAIRKMGFGAEETLEYMFCGITSVLEKLKKIVNIEPQNATMQFLPNNNQKFYFTKERIGYRLDFEKVLDDIVYKLENEQELCINIKPETLYPQIYLEELKQFDNKISSFYTTFNVDVANRVHNIKISANKFNGLEIKNGEEYSFNNITGRRTQEAGYLPANIIVDKKYIEGYGGGVCQVSTTLYNALLLAGIDILEVHSHSLSSNYVSLGFDAMVNYGSSDLRWVNNTGHSLYLCSYVKGNQIFFEVYGKSLKGITYKRITKIEKEILPPQDEILIDNENQYSNLVTYTDESCYITKPKKGYKVKAIMEKYSGSKLLESKVLRIVTYQPTRGIKVVGAKRREQITQESVTLNKNTVYFWQNFM